MKKLDANDLKVSITPKMIQLPHRDKNTFYSGAEIKLDDIDVSNIVSGYEIHKDVGEIGELILKIPLLNEPLIKA